eukprot:TRINITY_DN35869_c0_g1_i3.p1 TRINITY_DN35869_c0_g1~~TRINITY_DN35869_c0_g1_i3.p1  ORF type:complete len:225 (-),score=19.27 TRINITY_DN35869_c0_g1_i3:55-729(-)
MLLWNRSFMQGEGAASSHETLFLHVHLDVLAKGLRTTLVKLLHRIDAAAGWNVTKLSEDKDGQHVGLRPRCLEMIRYRASWKAPPVSWHGDGATLITMVGMLSRRGYEGGAIELRGSEEGAATSQEVDRFELQPGDVVAWRGWTQHRVLPLTRGWRDVFCAEWWLGEDCTETLQPRPVDTTGDWQRAIQLEPTAPQLLRGPGLNDRQSEWSVRTTSLLCFWTER